MSVHATQWALAQSASPSARIVLIALADYADAEGVCFPSVDALSEKSGVSPRTVKRAIAALSEAGLVRREDRRARGGRFIANVYRLALEEASPGAKLTQGQFVSMGHLLAHGKDKEPSLAVSATKSEPGAKLAQGGEPQVDWDRRLEQAHGLLDQPGSHAQGGLAHAAELMRLCRAGCDWDADIVPAIQKLAANFRRRGGTLRSWTLVAEDAIAFRDRRLAGDKPAEPGRVVSFPRRETSIERAERRAAKYRSAAQ